MTRIYLVRHAEAEGNLYRIAHGHYNGLITARGYKQIAALQQRFEHIHIDAVYSSDLFRTRTTATAVSSQEDSKARMFNGMPSFSIQSRPPAQSSSGMWMNRR